MKNRRKQAESNEADFIRWTSIKSHVFHLRIHFNLQTLIISVKFSREALSHLSSGLSAVMFEQNPLICKAGFTENETPPWVWLREDGGELQVEGGTERRDGKSSAKKHCPGKVLLC